MAAGFDHSPEFLRLLAGEPNPDLLRIALELARDAYPELDPARYVGEVDGLAARVRERCGPGARPERLLKQINWALFVEDSYEGNRDHYFDPRNSYLNEVIDRKRGIPISLSVLYQAVAVRLGVALSGVNLPAHFMLRLEVAGRVAFVDPFHNGELLDRDGCRRRIAEQSRRSEPLSDDQLRPCSTRDIVARMLRNLKAIYLGNSNFASALPVQRRLAAVEPDDPEERRDLGMICLQADRVGESIDPLAAYLAARPQADDASSIAELLSAARKLVAQWN